MDILEEITESRKKRTALIGPCQGLPVPDKRIHRIVPFGLRYMIGNAGLSWVNEISGGEGGKIFTEAGKDEKAEESERDKICKSHEAGGSRCFVIAEVKGKSPSAGTIRCNMDHVAAASGYIRSGIREISVLTEEEYFGGSLQYLMDIKNAFPDAAVLRKDFLLTEEDIEISYRAGADAVLLIAGILDRDRFASLLEKTLSLGMMPLAEVHSEGEIEMIRSFSPPLVGINSRDLKSFRTDLALPMMLAGLVDWPAALVFESGIKNEENALYAFRGGFSGILCGEALMKSPDLASRLTHAAEDAGKIYAFKKHAINKGAAGEGKGLKDTDDKTEISMAVNLHTGAVAADAKAGCSGSRQPRQSGQSGQSGQAETGPDCASRRKTLPAGRFGRDYFWRKLYSARVQEHGGCNMHPGLAWPLVKICGITNIEDAAAAEELGADLIGMVFAESPRRAQNCLPEKLSSLGVLKAAVVKNPQIDLLDFVGGLYRDGLIDVIQFHGNESKELCESLDAPWYRAVSFPAGSPEGTEALFNQVFSCPRILVDSSAGGKAGGTGQPVDSDIIERIRKERPLWLAGGISEENIASVIDRYSPELVDASSRLESSPGKKDHDKLRKFFREVERMRLRYHAAT